MSDTNALLVVYNSLYLVNETIAGVQIALTNNPSPVEALDLNDKLADLETEKDGLIVMRDQLKSGAITMPAPDPSLEAVLEGLVAQVEQATLNGATAAAWMALAATVVDTGISVMSLPS